MKRLEKRLSIPSIGMSWVTSELIHRKGGIAIYKRSDDVYEVFKVKVSPAAEIFGKQYPEREAYPANEEFGLTAWCFTDRERAMRRFETLLKNKASIAEVDT